MTCWTTTTKEDYYSKSGNLSQENVTREWSYDKKTCTVYQNGIPCLQMTEYYRAKVYYSNKNFFEGEH